MGQQPTLGKRISYHLIAVGGGAMSRMDLSRIDPLPEVGDRLHRSVRTEESCPNLMRRALQTHNDGQMPHVTSLVDGAVKGGRRINAVAVQVERPRRKGCK